MNKIKFALALSITSTALLSTLYGAESPIITQQEAPQACPRVTFSFDAKRFIEDCRLSPEIPNPLISENIWRTLFSIKNYYKEKKDYDKYIHTYHVMAKYLLAHNDFPNTDKIKFITDIINKFNKLRGGNNTKLKKWTYIYLSHMMKYYAKNYSKNVQNRLNDAWRSIERAIELKTTRTSYLSAAEIILDENYTPDGWTREEAVNYANAYIEKAFEMEKKSTRASSCTSSSIPEAFIVKKARPTYLKDLDLAGQTPVVDPLTDFDYSTLAINPHESVDTLPVRLNVLNSIGLPQGIYEIDGKQFERQNVSGDAMRCFFNSMGLTPDDQIALLRSRDHDPIIRYMIANEIISATANPEQIPQALKAIINFNEYAQKRHELDDLEEMRNEMIHNGEDLPPELQNLGDKGEQLLEELRHRSLSIGAFHAFLDHHILQEQMMVALLDIEDNGLNNSTSIDAIAYANNIGIKIMQEADGELICVHQFIPDNAQEIKYIYHLGVHFQALNLAPLLEDDVSAPIEIPSSTQLKRLYPSVNNPERYIADKQIIRKTLFLKSKNLIHRDIAEKLEIDSRRVSEILTANNIRQLFFISDDNKEQILEPYIKHYKDIKSKKASKVAIAKSLDTLLGFTNKDASLNFLANIGRNNTITDLEASEKDRITDSYKSGESILSIKRKNPEINFASILDVLGNNLAPEDYRSTFVYNVAPQSLGAPEKEELIIAKFNELKKQNKGQAPAILTVSNALKEHKIGYKIVQRILTQSNLIAQTQKSKHLPVDVVKSIRSDYNTGMTDRKVLAQKYRATLIQVDNIIRDQSAYTTGRKADIKENERRVVEAFGKLTPEQKKSPVSHLLSQIDLTESAIRNHLKIAGLYNPAKRQRRT